MDTELITYGYQPKTLTGPAGEAQKVLRKLWAHRDEWFYEDVTPEEVVRFAPETVIRRLLGFELEKVYEIPSESSGFKVAGYLDRRQKKIVVSLRQSPEVQRFTIAHEIGHAYLHPHELVHRDRPVDGSRFIGGTVPKIEREADEFATVLLMPADLLRKAFERCFDGPVIAREADEELSSRIAGTIGRRFPPSDIAKWKPFELARVIAQMEHFGITTFSSLQTQFAVSTNAMARRLCECGLVG